MYHDWEKAYCAAVLETDISKLPEKIKEALAMLEECLKESSCVGNQSVEQERMQHAWRTLKTIQRIELQTSA
jgi:hypothetical protein